jgi:uncharacterized protein
MVSELDTDSFPSGARVDVHVALSEDHFGAPFLVPAIVVRGTSPGPVLGITAAVHGNELNGVKVIHNLLTTIDPKTLSGTLIAIPVINLPGFIRHQREFSDGSDLNRIMPGKKTGTESQQYAHAVLNKIVCHFDYLIDLHTASFGRVNSLYIRADLGHSVTRPLAEMLNAEILLHNCGADGTLRGAAARLGIPALTVEVGNPQMFQDEMIESSVSGLRNVLAHLDMIDHKIVIEPEAQVCSRSFWIYSDRGGILDIGCSLLDVVEQEQTIACITNIYGHPVKGVPAPERGIIIGKSTNPVNQAGSRIIHLGVLGDDFTNCPLFGSE